MILRIDAGLTEPPSRPTIFRDVTLYATIFCDLDVLVECLRGTKSMYWKWLKRHGAHDFVKQLVLRGEEPNGLRLGRRKANITVGRLSAETLPRVTYRLMRITEGRCGI